MQKGEHVLPLAEQPEQAAEDGDEVGILGDDEIVLPAVEEKPDLFGYVRTEAEFLSDAIDPRDVPSGDARGTEREKKIGAPSMI